MLLSLLSVLAMGLMFIHMIRKASLSSTRKLAVLPLTACVMEMVATGALHPEEFPGLTLLLVLLRAAILFCCAGALRRDMLVAKRQKMRAIALAGRRLMKLEGTRMVSADRSRVRCA